jgi:hypothetical protein
LQSLKRRSVLGLAATGGLVGMAPAQAAPALRVRYPDLDGLGTHAFGYQVLKLALEKCGRPFELELHHSAVNRGRARRMLESGEIDTVDFGTSPAYERSFAALPFPIDKGLNGWRLLLIQPESQAAFGAVEDLAQLHRLSVGQGADWADTAILEAAGLRVVKAANLPMLFRMLEARRFDGLPLGADEIWAYQEEWRALAPQARVESHLALHYPFARLFFVRRDDEALRQALHEGLTRAFDDGAFDRLFATDPRRAGALARARLSERRIISIQNPDLTEAMRQIPPRYFFQPRAHP